VAAITESGPGALRQLAETLVEDRWQPQVTVREWWAALSDAGLAQPTWPEGLGGCGATPAEARAVAAVFGAAGTIAAPAGGIAALLAAPTLLEHGTLEQRARFVPAIARGEEAWCQLFSEPGAGSDLAGLTTTAAPDGDGWVVTGQKVWNSSADVARRGLLLARTDPTAPKHRGLTMFALDMDQQGIDARPLRQMNGEANFCEVFIDGARLRADEVIGDVGAGWEVARTTLRHERQGAASRPGGGLVAVMSGEKAGMLDRTVGEVMAEVLSARPDRINGYALPAKMLIELARSRGRNHDLVLRDRLVRYYVTNRINRMTTQRFRETGSAYPGGEGPLLKLTLAATCCESAELIFAVLGAAGTLGGADAAMEGALHRCALGSPGARIGGGTDEIQRNVIGERALGLPREPQGA
jgi:alkylation response protein AidB-like acyl-CoA dehydrogenase